MNLETMKAPTPARVDASELLSSAASNPVYPPFSLWDQELVDPVAWLAARANVASSTARVFAEINNFARCR